MNGYNKKKRAIVGFINIVYIPFGLRRWEMSFWRWESFKLILQSRCRENENNNRTSHICLSAELYLRGEIRYFFQQWMK